MCGCCSRRSTTMRNPDLTLSTPQVGLLLVLLPTLFLTLQAAGSSASSRPHILIIMIDDLGYSDVSFRDSKFYTPNIDKMARKGVKMTNSYMTYACTPSRAAFLTGIYPFHMGLQTQTMVFGASKNNTLPLSRTLLPEQLKKLNYSTHYVGKWHLGFCNPKTTPTGRGFDTFYGMYNGQAGHYDHISKKNLYDFHFDKGDNFKVEWEANGTYSTFLFTNRTIDILKTHDKSEPLFIFLSYQAIHSPFQVPDSYKTEYCSQWEENPARQTICGMVAALDEGIGSIQKKLKRWGYTDNLITIFISDNGGPVKNGSSNYPLRGGKKTLWEGGTKVQTILQSNTYLPKAPYEWNGLMHAIDWFPTLLSVAGADVENYNIDGTDNWDNIANNRSSNRTEFVYNIDLGDKNTSAIRWGKWKLINNKPGAPDGWYNPAGSGAMIKPTNTKYPEFMLYDLEDDSEEKKDLLSQEGLSEERKAEVQAAFNATKQKLQKYKQEVVPPMVAITMYTKKKSSKAWESGWCNATY